jgi:tetratricopeptide (TPR) repeat protein
MALSEPLHRRALAIYESSDAPFCGPAGYDTAVVLTSFAYLLCGRNKWAEAESLFERAISIYSSVAGDPRVDPDAVREELLDALGGLGNTQARLGKLREAEVTLRGSMRKCIENHARVPVATYARAKFNLGNLYIDTRLVETHLEDAKRLLGSAHADYLRVGPPQTAAAVRVDWARTKLRSGTAEDVAEAEAWCREALDTYHGVYGNDHVNLWNPLSVLSDALWQRQPPTLASLSEAAATCTRALELYRAAHGDVLRADVDVTAKLEGKLALIRQQLAALGQAM